MRYWPLQVSPHLSTTFILTPPPPSPYHQAGLNYKDDTRDPAVVVAFNVVGEENTAFVAWTTTPWTLPSNLALCVNPAFTYLKVRACHVTMVGLTHPTDLGTHTHTHTHVSRSRT